MSEIAYYCAKELDDMANNGYLPGYRTPGTLLDIIKPNRYGIFDGWTPILSLSIFRRRPEDPTQVQTLTGIRRSIDTHDGVVSTVTGKFPPAFQRPLLEERFPDLRRPRYPSVSIGHNGPNVHDRAIVASYRPNPSAVPDGERALPFLMQEVIVRKLGEARLIQQRFPVDEHLGKISLSRVLIGLSGVGEEDGKPIWEPLVMYGATLMLNDQYADAIPDSTDRYSHLGWTDVATFAAHAERRDVGGLAPYIAPGEAVQFCARGMCLATTAVVTQGEDLRGHLGLERPHYLPESPGLPTRLSAV